MNISDITIVIVSYYRGSRLNRCLDTIKDVPNIIVWDNNTTGEELELVKQAEQNHPNAKFIYSPENVGLTRAWNQGIINSETDWVLITCDDWSTKMTNEENLRDIISVNLIGEDFKNFLQTEAY